MLQYNEITDSTDAGIRFSGSAGDLHAYGNHIEGGEGNGIQVGSAGGGTFENNTITDVGRFGVVFYDDAWSGPGTARSSGSAFDDQRNEGSVIDNEITNAGVDGVRVDFGTGIEIRDNEITDSAEHGVRLAYRSATDDNVAEDFFRAAEDTTVSGNEIIGSGEIGLYVDTIANSITPGGSGGGGLSGPDPENEFPTGVFVTDNHFESNGNGTVFTPYVSEIEIENNTYVGHETDLVLDRVSNVVMIDNTFQAGLLVDGDDLEHFAHEAANNVFEDDAPLFYATGESGTTAPSDARQVFIVDSTDVTVDGIETEGMPVGVLVAYSDDVTVTDVTVTEADAGGERAIAVLGETNIDISGANVSGYTTGVEFEGAGNATFTDGNVSDSTGDGDDTGGIVAIGSDNVTIATTELAGHASHAIWFDEVEAGTVEANEVSRSERGIWVWNSGAVDISHNDVRNVTDRGIDAIATGVSLDFETATVIHKNLVVDGDAGGIRGSGAEAVTNNTVRDNDGIGISADGVIAGNHVEGNGGNGIFSGADDAEIRNNTVLGNEASYGIRVSTATSVVVERNDVEDNDGIGIQLNSVSDAVVEENTVANNDEDGIDLNGVSDIELFGNDVSAHTEFVGISSAAGVRVDADGAVTIESNTIEDNRDGLRIESAGSGDVTVTSNWILNNNNGVLIEPDADQISVTENDIAGNSFYGLRYDGDAPTLDSTNNWWGAENGPSTTGSDGPFVDAEDTDVVADGNGDEIHADSGPIQFSPFATTPQSDGDDPEESDGTITGTVVDEDSNAIEDAELTVIEQVALNDPATAPDGFTTVIVTDNSGEFSVDVPPGIYKLDPIAATGFDDGLEQNIEVESGETTTVGPITLSSIPVLTGTVTDAETDEPIAGVEIASRFFGDADYTATTNDDGEYAINIPEQSGQTPTVTFNSDGYEQKVVDADENVIDAGELDVELTPIPDPGTITGTVTANGVAVSNVFISAGERTNETDRDGTYELTLQPGTYTVSASAEDISLGTATEEDVTVEEGETTTLDLELEPPAELGTITGTVTDSENEPVPDIPVQVVDTATGEQVVSDPVVEQPRIEQDGGSTAFVDRPIGSVPTTSEDGSYILGVQPGTYEVSIFEGNEWIAAPVTVAVDEGKTVEGVDLTAEPIPDPDEVDFTVEILANESGVDVGDGENITVVVEITNDGDGTAAVLAAMAIVEAGVIDGDELPTDVDSLDVDIIESPRILAPEDTITETFSVESEPMFDGADAVVSLSEIKNGTTVAFDTIGLSVSGQTATLESITLNSAETTVAEESTTSVTVNATFNDGTVLNVTDGATIESDDTGVVSVDGATLQAESPGTTTVTATYEGETDSLEFTVEADEEEEETTPSPGGGGGGSGGDVDSPPEPEPELEVIEANVTPIQLEIGEEATIDATVKNVGDDDGGLTVPLEIGGETVEETAVTLDAGGSTDLTFTWTSESAGEFQMSVDGVDAGTVTVTEGPDADILIYGADVSQSTIILGDTVSVTGDLLNNGGLGTYEVDLNVDGERVETSSVEVGPGATPGAVAFEWTPTEADLPAGEDEMNATISLNGFVVETVQVENQYSDIQVISASTSEMEIIEGEETYVIGSLYQRGNIQGTEEIELTATHNETGETHVVGSQEATLSPNMYHLGAINITFQPDEAGHYDLKLGGTNAGWVDVEAAESDISVVGASVSEMELIEGEETYVIGSIYQGGNVEGTEEIELTATHNETGETEVIGSQEATLTPGMYHLGAINITFQPDESGHYDLELDGTNAGWVDVEAAESDISVVAASTSEMELIEGEETYVIGSLYQGGNIEGTEEIELTATHSETGETAVVGSQEATLTPGMYHLGAINITFQPDEAGHYDLELGDRNAGWVDVEEAESDISVVAASTSELEIVEGEETYVIGSLYQAGNIQGTEEIELTATHNETGETSVIGSQEATLSPGMYHLGAINITFEPDEPGFYDLELGDRNAGWVDVDESTVEASIVDVDGHSVNFDPDTETEQTYASEDVPVTVNIEADLDLETVTVLASSLETNYVRSFEASHDDGETWTATISPDVIEDDGRYEVSVVAVDGVGSAGTDSADNPLVIDRDAPRLSAALEDVDGEGATVVVESDKPLAEPPEVESVFTAPDGSTESGSVSMLPVSGSNTHFTGTFATGDTGTYEITSVGTDRAGNEGTVTASVTVDTRFTLGDGIIEIDDTGTAIEFDIADDADEAVLTQDLFASLSETTANRNLGDDQLGVGFITANLDNLLDYYLEEGTVESAEITMAIDEGELPGSASADEVELQYYDDASGNWDPVAGSSVTQINGDPFVTASVTGFSTYGAFVPDNEPPEITVEMPTDREVLDAGTESVDIRFEYDDPYSGVNGSSVRLEVNGVDRTDHENTSVTSSAIDHTLSTEDGASYDVSLSVTDRADNEATQDFSFEVENVTDTVPGFGIWVAIIAALLAVSLLVRYSGSRY